MIMNMNRKEILELNLVFNSIKKLGNTKFKYLVIRNIEIIKSYVEAMTELDKENKLILADFEVDRNQLIISIGKKNEDGKVFIDVNDEEMLKTFNDGLKVLIEKHKDSLDKYEEQFKILREILEEEIEEEFIFKSISIDEFPKEGISIEQLELLNKYNIIN